MIIYHCIVCSISYIVCIELNVFIVFYVFSGDDTPVANTNNIQTPSNPESNSIPYLNTPIINPNALTASTQEKPYSGLKTGKYGTWGDPGDR
jgi:hypothetical protein